MGGAVGRRRRWLVTIGFLLAFAGVVVAAYLQRIGPQFPAVEGTPFAIELAGDGCPAGPRGAAFVDSPGQFVPPSPTEVALCTTPTFVGPAPVPRQRVLHDGAADFASRLNAMPDRNRWFRDWQRKHSGLWPDRPATFACTLMMPAYWYSFALRYSGGRVVALVTNCTGWTTGARTRIDTETPHLVDDFVARFEAQT